MVPTYPKIDKWSHLQQSFDLRDAPNRDTDFRACDRLALVSAIIESLQDQPVTTGDRSGAIQRMRGLLKTDQPAPTDEDVAAMLEARRVEKYLS